MASSETGGVKPMSIAGRMIRERERLTGMTNEERAWRKQWLNDQILSKHEPKFVPEIEKELYNPIRRFYRFPLDKFRLVVAPIVGTQWSHHIRFWAGKALLGLAFTYSAFYYFKYNQNDWTRKGGWRVISSRKSVLPGDPDYPKVSDRNEPADYAARGFKESVI